MSYDLFFFFLNGSKAPWKDSDIHQEVSLFPIKLSEDYHMKCVSQTDK